LIHRTNTIKIITNRCNKKEVPCVYYTDMEQNDFEIEVRRIRPKLLNNAMRYLKNSDDAEDVTQEVLLKLWTMRLHLDEYLSVEALAMTISKHLCLNRLRMTNYSLTDLSEVDVADRSTPEELYIDSEEDKQVVRLMETLPDVQQTTLRMKHIDGLEVEDIARITGSAEATVRSNLSRARKKMMNYFLMNK